MVEGPRAPTRSTCESSWWNTAPALFALTCGDHGCRDGGHDLTSDVLRGLLAGATHFEVADACLGNVGAAECGRTMRVEVSATYR